MALNKAELALNRYERLEQEFNQYKKKVGSLKAHSKGTLLQFYWK